MISCFSLVIFSVFLSPVKSLECYSCYVRPPPRSPFKEKPDFEPLCSKFDGSEKFIVNCTQSTFCMTRTYKLHLRQGKSVVITERGCAKQVYQYQALERGKWKTITTIMEETYTSGCVKDSDWAEHRATDTEYCYCQEDRCNNNTGVEEEEPIRSDYQDNFIESHGLQIASQGIEEINFYNVTSQSHNNSAKSSGQTFNLGSSLLIPFAIMVLLTIL